MSTDMPAKDTNLIDDIELVLEDLTAGGGGNTEPPDVGGGDDGDGAHRRGRPSHGANAARKYSTAIVLAMVSITMFFMAIIAAFLVLRATSKVWVTFHVPLILWGNTAVLLLSSIAIESAKKKLELRNLRRFQQLWWVATALGILFLVGQTAAWFLLVEKGIYASSTLATGFFYVFTAAHGAHLLGGVCALIYVAMRRFDGAAVSRSVAAEVVSYYWHFMDGLWLFLLALLYFGS
jgi:cytochrome c oxidase subunit 3